MMSERWGAPAATRTKAQHPERLTRREKVILDHLIEECEATIAAAKILQTAGRVDNPDTLTPCARELGLKAGAVFASVKTAENAGLFREVDITDGMQRKREQLVKYTKQPAWQEPA